MHVIAMGPGPPLSCSAERLPSEITGTCTGEAAAPLAGEGAGRGTALAGRGSVGPGSPSLSRMSLLPHSLFLKSPFLSDKPQNF